MGDDHSPIPSAPMEGGLVKRASTATLIFLLIVLYVLSIGPAWCLRKNKKLPDVVFIVVYLPVLLPSHPLGYDELLNEYRDWWLSRFS